MRIRFAGKVNGDKFEVYPTTGTITDYFGRKRSLSGGKAHTGADIANDEGTPVSAPMPGTVHSVWRAKENPVKNSMEYFFGNCVILRHSDDEDSLIGFTLYAHFSEPSELYRGDKVDTGDLLGLMGSTGLSTGPHLHWGATVADNPYLSRSKGLNDAFDFLDDGEDPGESTPEAVQYDEQQKRANDLIDAGQSILNDLIDDLQGKTGDI